MNDLVAASATPRIDSLDFLRGVAVMGILVANLPAFGLPEAAYFSPAAWGGTSAADVAAWFVTFVFVEGKMRGLFSLLFGASMLLVVERAEASGRSGAGVHFRRMAWLFVMGCAHLYGLWSGDILAHYALCGAVAFLFIRLPVKGLISIALGLIAWETLEWAGLYAAILDAQAHSGEGSRKLLASMAGSFGTPPARELAAEIAAFRGTYAQAVAWRWTHATQPFAFLLVLGPETLATMSLGMAGLKSGFLTGAWPPARYRRWALMTLGISLPLYAAVGLRTMAHGLGVDDVVFGALTVAAPLRNITIIGYAALGILAMHRAGWLTRRIAAAGRVAFTNYLGTSLVVTTIFYGYGLGLFGHVSRIQLHIFVPVIWVTMLAWSQSWLEHHRFGPLEWLWRSLARWQLQPINRADRR